jgi:hypothetical protein
MYVQVANIKITFGIKNIFGQNLSSPSIEVSRYLVLTQSFAILLVACPVNFLILQPTVSKI